MSFRDVLLLILGLLVAYLVLTAILDSPEGTMRTVPEHLRGVWVTSNPSYGDRFLKLSGDSITFGIGGVNDQTFKITGFDQSREVDGRDLNTVYFRSADGASFSRQFHFSRQGRNTLVFVNQPDVVWAQ